MKQTVVSVCLLIILYGSEWCGYCIQQEQQLRDMRIEFAKVPFDKRPIALKDYHLMPLMVNTKSGQINEGYIDGPELTHFVNGA